MTTKPEDALVEPIAWRWRYFFYLNGRRINRAWIVRQSPVEPSDPADGLCGTEVQPLYLADAITTLLERERRKDEALKRINNMTDIEADFDGFEAREIARAALTGMGEGE